ncbi:helix-turn-helix domain-containing protein [Paenibacillus polymyxa]|uniref:helix-turn-helix domain-containing protein n=1 Tax=Paenibacillus TaxID=44249 RepID=UPI0002EC6CCB|nr:MULTISPECIES: helix-turn-helix transcriptional regulator [Paenibacillus]KAF6657560.1 helix-turn-helix transcriptional regulator [Paenibacillus sp. EKM301P]NMP09692.1 helix-turn-helix transcriptional regulator [Paenibacillus polymyxa]RPE07782.1 transcriptional regulator [Paenibacillus polymyxa]UBS88722.1 helix-turn-helix transcriptional regulator [Paenibacillus polymyxa]WHX37318.1 helix-turn-helix transcriptional regulator [Paenibacillus polymyxa]
MEIIPTIRAEVQTYLIRKSLTMTEFGHMIDLNVGTVSGIVTGNRSISVHQLDRITMGMNLPPDYFYERYIDECIEEEPLNWRRISPFLYRCVELGRLDCLRRVVGMLLDNPIYLPSLFEVAEDSYKKGFTEAAAFLYENVAEGEKYQYSERLAVCQYRLFTIRIGDDQEKNYDAAIQFEPYVERLDEIDQLDALRALVNTYRSLRKWDKLDVFAKALGNKATIQYKIDQQHHENNEHTKKPLYPPFVYWAFSHLIRAEVCDANKDYETALQHIQRYADLSWVEEKDKTTLEWKNQFKEWATANIYVNRLMSGDLGVIPDYVAYFSSKKGEILPAIDNIIEAANRYNINVDHILEMFKTEIQSFLNEQNQAGVYTQQISSERFTHLSRGLAIYHLREGKFSDGFTFLFSCLEKSAEANNRIQAIRCMRLFTHFKEHASAQTKAVYGELIKAVNEEEE